MAKEPRARTRLRAALRDRPGLTIVDLSGDLDGQGDEALNAAFSQAANRTPGSILLNFASVGYINSKGIALLINLLLRARQSGHRLLAGGLTRHYQEIFDITRLSDFFDVVPDEAAALESIRNRVSLRNPVSHLRREKKMATFQADVKIEVQRVDATTCILDIKGELTAFAEDRLMGAYNDGCGAPVQNVILNFQRLEYMSSSGIGLLVTLLIRAQRQQQRLLATGLSDHYRHIFELTRLDEAIGLYPTLKEAVDAVGALASPARGR